MSNDYTANRITGALPPPPGVIPNFIDPPNQNAGIIALHTVCLTIATLFLGIRLYLRALVLRSFGWDDAFCLIGWAFAVAYTGLTLKVMTVGLGTHLWDLPASRSTDLGEWLYIDQLMTRPGWLAIKLAFFLSYLRIFGLHKSMRWLCWGGAVVCAGLYVSQIFHDIFVCIPVQKDWDPKIPGHCLPSGVGGSVTAIFNVISDVYILVLPLPFIWKLQLQPWRKFRLMLLFGVGVFVNACSITRLVYTYTTASDKDVSWKLAWQLLWITLEVYVGLICVCALVLPSFYSRIILPSWSSLRSKTSSIFGTRKTSTTHHDPERGLELVHAKDQHSTHSSDMAMSEHNQGVATSGHQNLHTASDTTQLNDHERNFTFLALESQP